MANPLQIWILSDGKQGHENQSLGLAEAIQQQTPAEFFHFDLTGLYGIGCRIRRAFALANEQALPPDLILGAGHSTHLALLFLARKWNVPAVVIMKPSLPYALFDACLVPYHDINATFKLPSHVFPTFGAINRVRANPHPETQNRHTVLIGGPSKHFLWDSHALCENLAEIFTNSAHTWTVADSRRTPIPFVEIFSEKFQKIPYISQNQTEATWLPEQLFYSETVWVTEDSVSMIHEALSSGARVGILPVPHRSRKNRLVKGIQRLTEHGFITPFSEWKKSRQLAQPPRILNEAQRAATWILQQFFPTRA